MVLFRRFIKQTLNINHGEQTSDLLSGKATKIPEILADQKRNQMCQNFSAKRKREKTKT